MYIKRESKFFAGILLFILVLTVGYALFSETITINGTATGKGDLKLTTTALTDEEIDSFWGLYDKGMISNANINVSGDTVTTGVTLGMPGSAKQFVIKVENTGTIPVYLKSITDENGKEYDGGVGGYVAGKEVQNADRTTMIIVDVYPEGNAFGDYEDEMWGYFDGSAGVAELSEYILDPGEVTYYSIEYVWPSVATSQEPLTVTFTANLNWQQASQN